MNYEEEYKALKSKFDLIERTSSDDNLNYLINQIQVGNIKTSDNDRVINILNVSNNGFKQLKNKLNSKPKKTKKD